MAVLVIYGPDRRIAMVVHGAANPDDPAFNPPGAVRVDMPDKTYRALRNHLEIKEASVPLALERDPVFAALLEQDVAEEKARIEAERLASVAVLEKPL